MNNAQTFSQNSDQYARSRPQYPPELFAYLSSLCPGHTAVWDCATGNGQAAVSLAEYFARIEATDISTEQLQHGLPHPRVRYSLSPAEHTTFSDATFDLVSVAFGLRNMTHKEAALAEMARVVRPGGKLLVLEFSKPAPLLQKPYDWYSFTFMPLMGKLIANDADSYRYLAESIRMHPGQEELKTLMHKCGFGHVDFHNMTGGVVAVLDVVEHIADDVAAQAAQCLRNIVHVERVLTAVKAQAIEARR